MERAREGMEGAAAGGGASPYPREHACEGFLLEGRGPGVLHLKLVGRFARATLKRLDTAVLKRTRPSKTTFLLLDASTLTHIPVDVARNLAEQEARWRSSGVVCAWVGLSPYLANLLVLASGIEQLPALPDLPTALRAIAGLANQPHGLARSRLEAWSGMRH